MTERQGNVPEERRNRYPAARTGDRCITSRDNGYTYFTSFIIRSFCIKALIDYHDLKMNNQA